MSFAWPDPTGRNKVAQLQRVPPALIAITAISIALRFWSRLLSRTQGGSIWWDDWFALIAFLFAIGQTVLTLYGVALGDGRPYNEYDWQNIPKALLMYYIGTIFFMLAIWLVKYSALLFYARLFSGNRKFRRALWISAVIISSWMIVLLMTLFGCTPLDKFWNYTKPGHCASGYGLNLASAILDPVLDLLVLLVPMPMIWNLRMTTQKKMLLTIAFAVGYLALLTSIARLVTTAINGPKLAQDPFWNGVEIILWSAVEVNVSIISLSLPASLQLIKRFHDQGFRSLFRRDSESVLPTKVSETTNRSSRYTNDKYGFSPIRTSFTEDMMKRKNTFPMRSPPLPAIIDEDDSYSFPRELSAVHVRRDITVKRDEDEDFFY